MKRIPNAVKGFFIGAACALFVLVGLWGGIAMVADALTAYADQREKAGE